MGRILIVSGGTGGHFYPGFALGTLLRERGHNATFLVRKGDPALQILERDGFPSVTVDMRGMPRKISLRWALFALKTAKAFRIAWNIMNAWRPDCVVGMGAFLTFPNVFTAWIKGIPALIHEANAQFGLSNWLSKPFASRVALGLPIANARLGGKAFLSGTPVRPGFRRPPEASQARTSLGLDVKRETRTILVFGGSQGASALNRVAAQAFSALSRKHAGRFQALHLAGEKEAEGLSQRYRQESIPVTVMPYLEQMELAMAAADLVLCRAGASTIAELIAVRKPAIVVPFPYATAGHQSRNASVISEAGAAVTINESELTPERLAELVEILVVSKPESLLRMREAYSRIGLPHPDNAALSLAECVEDLIDRGNAKNVQGTD